MKIAFYTSRHARSRAIVTGLVLAVLAPLTASAAEPAISIMPPEYDFGLMQQLEARSTTLIVRNEGDAVLELGEVETTCGCTVAHPELTRLKPGESTPLEITYNSKHFRDKQLNIIKIHSNDPRRPVMEIPIVANVHVALRVDPKFEAVGFSAVSPGSDEERTLTVSTEDVPELTLEPVRYREDLFTVEIRKSPQGNPAEKIIAVRIKDGAPIGPFREIMTFASNVDSRPSLDIEVTGRVTAPISISPEDVNFRYALRNQRLARTFTVIIDKTLDAKVVRAEIDLPGFEVKGIERKQGTNNYLITIEGRPLPISDERAIAAKGRLLGRLHVFTDNEAFPELTAKVKYLLKI